MADFRFKEKVAIANGSKHVLIERRFIDAARDGLTEQDYDSEGVLRDYNSLYTAANNLQEAWKRRLRDELNDF